MRKSDSFEGNESVLKLVVAAESSAQRQDWRTADELFQQAISLDSSPASRIAYGVCLSQQERYFDAISIFTPILDGDDLNAIGAVCHNLAAIYREVGDLDLATRFQLRSSLMHDHSGPDDLLGLANDAIAGERHEAADALIRTVVDITHDPADPISDGDIIATTGLIHSQLSSVEEGLFMLLAAYRQHQSNSEFRNMGFDQLNMAMLFGQLQRHRAERACLQRAIRCFEQAQSSYSLKRAQLLLDGFDRMRSVRSLDGRHN